MSTKLPIKIELPEGYLQEEERCGYLISEKQKKIWAVELDLFAEFARVCKKHDIKFSVAYGTMLGAVRHKGFIPWDDDFDIMMERDEYEKLMLVAADEFSYPYFLQTALNDRAKFHPCGRLRNSETTGYVTGFPKTDYNNGIYLDLYCFDANPQSRIKYLWKHFCKRVVGKLLGIYYQSPTKDVPLFSRFLKPWAHIFSYETLWAWYCKILAFYNGSELRYSNMISASRKGCPIWISKEALSDIVMMPYEFCQVPVIREYKQFLQREYGDYMAFPPVEKRGKWHEGIIHFEPEIPYTQYLSETT